MKLSMTVEGATEAAKALDDLKNAVPSDVTVALNAGMQPIALAMKSYPPQPPYMGMKAYGSAVTSYKRTGNYGQRITIPPIQQRGSEFVGYINSPASYSTYLRGDLDGGGQVWMHKGVWPLLKVIVDRLWPVAAQRIEQQLSRLINRLGLGD